MKYKIKVNNKMKAFGSTDLKKKLIEVNKIKAKKSQKGELLNTIIHEQTHAKHPMMKEKNIIKKTAKITKKMSKKQKMKVYKKLK